MTDINTLLDHFEHLEKEFGKTPFLAPCVSGGLVRARVAGLVITMKPIPYDFVGWGIFRPRKKKRARLIEEASISQKSEYLSLLQSMGFWLVKNLSGRSWLGIAINQSDAMQRFNIDAPVIIHLVEQARHFDQVIAGFDGGNWWFNDLNRRADPILSDNLRQSMNDGVDNLQLKGITPEIDIAYQIAWQDTEQARAEKRVQDERGRIKGALDMAGGELRDYEDRGDYWIVHWRHGGEQHRSAISKQDLTVISAGICLSGTDRTFDLQSLVGVVNGDRW